MSELNVTDVGLKGKIIFTVSLATKGFTEMHPIDKVLFYVRAQILAQYFLVSYLG